MDKKSKQPVNKRVKKNKIDGGILVINFGGQYAHLIAKQIRSLGASAIMDSPEVLPHDYRAEGLKGIILSGGPRSVWEGGSPELNPFLWRTKLPILGLCYGHQLIARIYGGGVNTQQQGEYGKTRLESVDTSHPLFKGLENAVKSRGSRMREVWMSHQDTVREAPPGFEVLASTRECPVIAMADDERKRYGLQFHPEVKDTPFGRDILANFLELAEVKIDRSMRDVQADLEKQCKIQVGERKVLMFLSGGVDSTVAFALLNNALGVDRVRGIFVDNGFLRLGEVEQVRKSYAALGWKNIKYVDASAYFLRALKGLTDPQEKRIAVGEAFLRVRDIQLKEMGLNPEEWMLGQGTLYPDIIESGGEEHAAVIKWHHNRVPAIADMIKAGLVIEPLKDLYKDEVRELGTELGLPKELVWRHPFPGPGLSINVICSHWGEHSIVDPVKGSQMDELPSGCGYKGMVLPVFSVGVQGDARTYVNPACLSGLPDWEALEDLSTNITNEVSEVNRVVYLLGGQLSDLSLQVGFCDKGRLDVLRDADWLATTAFEKAGWMEKIFQLLVILLPFGKSAKSGSVVLRPVISEDVMTARFAQPPWELLEELTPQLLELPAIDAVFYDITHKPPATFGWE